MKIIKNFWWLFGVLAVVVGFVNPYYGILSVMNLSVLIINAVFIIIGLIRKNYSNHKGATGLIYKLQRIIFWPLLLISFIMNASSVYFSGIFTFSQNRKHFQIITLFNPLEDSYVPIVFVCFVIFVSFYFILYSMRIYELYWKNNL